MNPVPPQPDETRPPGAPVPVPGDLRPAEPRRAGWIEKTTAVLFCVFCIQLGLVLLVFPWVDSYWDRNWLFQIRPDWQPMLLSQQFRGAISGLGILNIFLGFAEVLRLARFARPASHH